MTSINDSLNNTYAIRCLKCNKYFLSNNKCLCEDKSFNFIEDLGKSFQRLFDTLFFFDNYVRVSKRIDRKNIVLNSKENECKNGD